MSQNEESPSPSSISKPRQIRTPTSSSSSTSSNSPAKGRSNLTIDSKVRKTVSFLPLEVGESSPVELSSSERRRKLRERVSPPSNLNLQDLNTYARSAPQLSPIGQSPLSATLPRVHFSASPPNDFVRYCQTPNPKPSSSHSRSEANLYTPQTKHHMHYRAEFGKSPINDFFFGLVSSDLIRRDRAMNDSDEESDQSSDEEKVVLVEEKFTPPPFAKSASMSSVKFEKSNASQLHSIDALSSRKLRTMSLDLRDSNQWFTYRLTMVKHQTDQDLRMYISELDEMTNTKFGGNLDPPCDKLPKDDIEKLLRDHIRVLRTIALNIIDCSVQQLQDGEHKQIVKHLQKLNASLLGQERKLKEYPSVNMEKRRVINRECSKLVRKLIFIFSRCSRLLEFLRVQNNSVPASLGMPSVDLVVENLPKRKRVHSMVASPKAKINLEDRLQELTVRYPRDKTSPITPIKTQTRYVDDFVLVDKEEHPSPLKKDEELSLPKVDPASPLIEKTPEDPLRRSIDSKRSIPSATSDPDILGSGRGNEKASNFFTKLVTKWKSWTKSAEDFASLSDPESPSVSPSVSPKRGRSPSRRKRRSPRNAPPYIELLCRICEELVRSDELEEHSKTCAIRHNIDMRSITCDDRLIKLVKSIQKRIIQSETDKSRSSLSEQELHILQQLSLIAKRAADLKYTNENLIVLQDMIDEMPKIQQQSLLLPSTKLGLSKSISIDSIAPVSNEQEKDRRYSLKLNNALTLDIFCKRIEEVMKVKLKTMQERMQLSPNVRVHRVSITDFEILKPISRGAFGRVFLARKKKTGDLYAVKVLRKRDMIRKNQTKRVITERNVMAAADNDFVVRFYYSFSGKEYLYIVMEYCPGGDIFSLLREREQFDCDMIRHYAAEIVLALEHLHSKGIVHRDLKPDNILIGQDGHIKLTDFGLSEFGLIDKDPFFDEDDTLNLLEGNSPQNQQISPSAETTPTLNADNNNNNNSAINKLQVNGTPDYLAPEILLGNEHSFPVDFWALGCMIYEFLYGVPPFHDRSPEAIFDNILSMNIEWPDLGDPEEDDEEIRNIRICSDLARQLLVSDPSKRLDVEGIKTHPFFAKVDWNKILTQTPPFIPQPVTEEDTSYFSARLPMFPVSEDEGLALMNDTSSPPSESMARLINSSRQASNNSNAVHQGSVGSDKSLEDIKLGSFEDLISPNGMLSSSMDFSFGNLQHYENLAHKTMEQLQLLKNRRDKESLHDLADGDRSSFEGETNSYSDDTNSLPCYSPTHAV